jgi:hypothetical protein
MRVRESSNDVLRQLGCTLTPCGMRLPKRLSLEDWAAVGRELGKQQNALQWQIGDWWILSDHSYGERSSLVETEDWTGPAYSTCANVGTVCKAFELSRRRESLSFSHHLEVADLPPQQADELLNWAAEPLGQGSQRRSVRDLREEKGRRKPKLRSTPTFGTIEPKAMALTVVPAPRHEPEAEALVLIPAAAAPRHEPEVQEQLGEAATQESSTDREAREVALAGLYAALRKDVSVGLREQLQHCVRTLANQ